MDFRVELDAFRGPLDLLLYLVRKHEVEITEIPIASITDQFIAYLDVLRELSVNDAGEFLEMASTLVEIKSRMLLPRPEEVEEARRDVDVARLGIVAVLRVRAPLDREARLAKVDAGQSRRERRRLRAR